MNEGAAAIEADLKPDIGLVDGLAFDLAQGDNFGAWRKLGDNLAARAGA